MSAAIDRSLPNNLSRALTGPTKEYCRQAQLSPELSYGRHRGPAPDSAQKAAVLLAFFWHDDEWYLPLTQRPETITRHSGQISLPGGILDPGESSSEAAAREFREELGIEDEIELLGPLPKCYVFASHCEITPWVAVLSESPDWKPNDSEVQKVIDAPLRVFLNPQNVEIMTIVYGQLAFAAPYYPVAGDQVWGATAVILSELASLIKSSIDR